ncbi:MAG: phosphotransferase [Acidimicrobiaceae bacterium]|nr:phosphotransferase [Acidimicrobiaceae bacterium]
MADEAGRAGEAEVLSGRVTEFLRLGDTVRRPANATTESMRQLLVHLEHSGFAGAPRVVESESDDAIVLTWIDGWVPTETEGWKLDLEAVESVGKMLRSYHDCAAGFIPTTGFEEGPQVVDESRIVCHGDIAPRNTVFRDGRAVAFIDWDGIWAATPLWDLGHAVWQFAPICDDEDPWIHQWPETPDRSARIAALVSGYRLDPSQAQELAEMVVEVIAGCRRCVVRKAAAGMPAFVQLQREGVLESLDNQRHAAEELQPLILKAVLASVS